MSTRGLYGFRKNGVLKCTYNHNDSYPSWLGREFCKFIYNNDPEDLSELFDRIILVDEYSKPTQEQINICKSNGYCDLSVSTKSEENWYCLLREIQGNFNFLQECIDDEEKEIYMIDNQNFIDQRYCQYSYIFDIDNEVLEFRDNHEHSIEFDYDELGDEDEVSEIMEVGNREVYEMMDKNSYLDLTQEEAEELISEDISSDNVFGIFKDFEAYAEDHAREFGILTDKNERYFDLSLYIEDLLDDDMFVQLNSGRVAYVGRW